ncbi:MAG: TIM barrel protein [Candidatus Omnitrophota bacterium]|nr:TIM barrel protein [Candidatus Omnitrophota bacterium]
MSYALSTSWNAARFSEGAKVIEEIKKAGFNEVELSFNLTPKIIKGILRLAQKKEIKVVSLHNYCPIPKGLSREFALPDVYSLSSINEEERKTAVYFSKKSIDSCVKFKARVLVLHCGYVEIVDHTRRLIELYLNKDTAEFTLIKNTLRQNRQAQAKEYLMQAIKSLEELNGHAEKSGVFLGIENRFYAHEIPSYEEVGIILSYFKNKNIFYWHDTGHAQVMESLGFVNHACDFLKAYGAKLIGMHIHDVKFCRDHLAPLKGDLDFSLLAPYITDKTIKVIEAHAPATLEEIMQARQYLGKILG